MSAEDVYKAVERGDLVAVRQMVWENPSLEQQSSLGWTLLRMTTHYGGHMKIIRYLVGEGDKNKGCRDRFSPLYWAAMKGHLDAVRYLVEEAGVDKDKVDRHGWTPLMYASFSGCLDVLRYLLEEGADVTLKNKDGKTALTYAGNEIAALLREYLPGGLMYQRRDAVINVVLNQNDLGPDVARFCGDFIMNLT